MTFAGALTVLATHLTTAGAASTPTITDIGAGEPGIPPGRCGRYWYEGDGASEKVPQTLADRTFMERLTLRFFWPAATRDKAIAAALEVDVQATARALSHALIGDSQLGGNVVDITLGNSDAGWLLLDGGAWRTLTVDLGLHFVDIDTIGA